MTVLGAVVFGGLLALGVLWLLVTAPSSEVDQVWSQPPWADGPDPVSAVLTHSSRS
jgi:hypothetical protein